MNDMAKTEDLTIEQLGGEIRLLTRQARQMVLEYGIQIGYRLQLAKDKVGEDFAGWVERETEISKSSAYRFIQLYKEYGSKQGSLFGADNLFPTLGNISVSNALRLIAIPEEEREEFAKEVDAEHLSARELGEAILERDEARRRAEEAEQRADKAENELFDAKTELEDQITKREDAENAAEKMEKLLREAEKAVREAESRPVEVAIDEAAVQKAAEDARKAAEEEKVKEIDALKKALKAAEDAKTEAEKALEEKSDAAAEKAAETARAAKEEAETLRKKLRAAESGANEAILLVRLAQENFNLAIEKLRAMKTSDAETANKLIAGTKKILETLIGRCG